MADPWSTIQNAVVIMSRIPLERWLFRRDRQRELQDFRAMFEASGQATSGLQSTQPTVAPQIPNKGSKIGSQNTAEVAQHDVAAHSQAPSESGRATKRDEEIFTLYWLQKALQGLEVHLPTHCKTNLKPCDCCDKHSADVDLYASENVKFTSAEEQPFYRELAKWGAELNTRRPDSGNMTDEEYNQYADQAYQYRKRVQRRRAEVGGGAAIVPTSPLSLAEAKTLAAQEAARAIEERWQEAPRDTTKAPRLIGPRERRELPTELEFFADSAEHIDSSIDHNGLRPKLETAFRDAIKRAKE